MALLNLIYLLILCELSSGTYFEDQPKFLTENGNFIIESAVDRNITFRLKGTGFLNINDLNLMNVLRYDSNATIVPNTNLAIRLQIIEAQLNDMGNVGSNRVPNRNVLQRLNRLENRMNNVVGNFSLATVNRRIRQIEIRFNRLVAQLSADNCTTNPCKNGGTCTNIFGGYICKCSDAWTGTNCDEDVNECAIYAGTDLGCQNSISCQNTLGGYNCQCLPGWQGLHCTRRNVDCLTSSSELCGKGACVQTSDANGYRCICDQGWTTNGVTPACTVDVNECLSVMPHCSMDPEVPCINIPGSYMCGQCPHGYTGNGHYCKDIDECETNNGGCSTSPFVSCINTRGSYRCGVCPFGYTGDGRVCFRNLQTTPSSLIPSMASCENSNMCHPAARCVQNSYGIVCICPPLHTGNGYGPSGCVRLNTTFDVCARNPCQNGGTCTNVGISSFTCTCPPGTIRPLCVSANNNPCAINPCRNGGTCVSVGVTRYLCACPRTFTGVNCQTEVRACGGVINGLTGTLKYPSTANNYAHNSRCAWLLKTDANKVLNVTFTQFNLENSRECRFDWLQIHDGRSSASYMIGRFCGSDLPKGGNIISTQNMLYLWFRSDNSTAHDGFELTWNTTDPVCGGELTIITHGTISSPGSPGNYPPNRNCIWTLSAPPGKRIQFHFFTMQLEVHATCQYDYLAIYSGLTTDDVLIDKFCNTTHPEPLITPSNEATLHFHSDEDSNDAGFQIHYSVVEGFPGCGGTFTAVSGEFGSPIQDGVYPKNVVCHYVVRLPSDGRVRLTFLSFKTEPSSSCSFDYVEIYEGSSEKSPKVGKWCGDQIPPTYSSQTNQVLVLFKSDWSSSYDGFRVKYETVCGGKFDAENGIIKSPFYPSSYEPNRNCEYDIEAPMSKAIILDFSDFDVEADCDFDSLSIYDGVDRNSTRIGQYCGTSKPPRAVSSFNYMHLEFEVDSSISGRGFIANYSFIDLSCGGIIKKLGQTISPPTFQNGYKHESECKWLLIAPVGYLVQLTFSSFGLESFSDCRYDYVAVYNGVANESAQAIGKYCGSTVPPVILSSENALTMVFKSDDSVNGEGFVATYSFIDGRNLCGGKFYSPTGTIHSPGWPDSSYPPNKDCIWVIQAPNGKQIELNVKTFELEENTGCTFDSLEIRNGASDKSPLIGTFCGVEILPRIKSFSNHLYLRFRTDSSNERKGFEIDYDSSTSGCGGIFSNIQRGSLTSPSYPEPYGANMQCDWRISVSRGSTLNLIITDLDLESSSDCSFDYISIYDGIDASAKLLGTYCTSDHPLQIDSTTNNIFIRMVSDVSNQGRGFEIKFNSNCKREIFDLRGAIESPNFPSNYPHNANCEWKITPPLGNKIYVEFSHFELEHSYSFDETDLSKQDDCMFDHLTIEERDSSDSVIRSDKYCETTPKAFTTSHTLILKFETDFSNSDRGFHLEYEVQGCGGMLHKAAGRFTSPNYPKPYPHDTRCNWVIEAEYGNLIEITFKDFDFEASVDCNQDGLLISSEPNDKGIETVISKFCGSIHNTTGVVTSSGSKAYVRFFSDVSYAGRGFTAEYRWIPSKCGGIFTLPQGRITSQNYPKNYEANTQCEWLLRTEPSHSLAFKFTDFDLEASPNCTSDSVRIYEGNQKIEEKLLLRVCGTQMINGTAFSNQLKSQGNEMLVVMETNGEFESKGFSAQYEIACGSKINTSSNGILEIGHNLRWLAEDCQWTVTANDPNQHVSLSIMHIDNEPVFQKFLSRFSNQSVDDCLRKIFIHDGSSIHAPKIMEICSNKHPPTIVSAGNSLTISLDNVSENDFAFAFDIKAYYSVLDNECGGEFSSVSGQIASPGYPKTYPNNIECEWTVKASQGSEMTLTIDFLDIDQSEHCNGDYLEVRETNSVGKLIGVYCGTNVPPTLPQTNKYWLKFRSDNDGVGRGFKLEYNYARVVEQTGDTGVVTSLLYPSFIYFTIGSYQWRITVDVGSVISVSLDNCILKRDSKIQIYDGYDSSTALLSSIETDMIPDDIIISTTNVILIEFKINTFSESKFKIIWNKVPKVEANDTEINSLNCSKNSIVTVRKTDVLHLQSPGFPNGYDHFLNCMWSFLPSEMGYHVATSFSIIDLEVTSDCIADFVRVSSSSDMVHFANKSSNMCSFNHAGRRNRFHGTPNLRIEFQTDYVTNRTGFESLVMLDCGGLLEGTEGQITDSMTTRPTNVTQVWMNDTCEWMVNVKRGRTIQFAFQQMDLQKNPDGSCNSYLIIRNGPNEDSPFLGNGKFCGSSDDITALPKTSSNKAIVQYVRGRMLLRKNFTLRFQQIEHDCGGDITLDSMNNSTIITTPNYPNIPNAHIECVWRVNAPNGELMKIEVLERFDLTLVPNCVSEYLEIREGSTSSSLLIGRYCKMWQPIFTTSNMVRLRYYTDVTVPKNGFKLKISFAKCGKSITAYDSYFSSPGYPGKGAYPTQSTCEYHITGRAGSVLNFTFVDLDLPASSNCSNVDHIVFRSVTTGLDGSDSYREFATVCGALPASNVISDSSVVLVQFVTKAQSGLHRGFRLFYNSSRDTCGGKTEASAGIIQSPGYPIGRDLMRFCDWSIRVPKGRRVKVEFLDYDLHNTPSPFTTMSSGSQIIVLRSAEQRISFHNDFSYMSRIKIVDSAAAAQDPIYSTDNMMIITSVVRSNAGHRGFKLRFSSDEPTICDGNFDQNEGSFQNPKNITSFYCEYMRNNQKPLIDGQPNQGTISIKIVDESIYNTSACYNGLPTGIAINFIDNEKRNLYSKCPRKYDNIASPYPTTKIMLRNTIAQNQYRFQYKIHNCGGILTSQVTNKITQPSFDFNYGELDCAWQFTSRTNRNLQLTIANSQFNCDTEYINVYSGRASNHPRVGRICGDANNNRSFTVSNTVVFFEYHTDNYNASSKFQIELVTSDGVCGGTLEPPNYIFSSPMNGTKYPSNTECTWILRAQNGFHIGLYFPKRFMLETSNNCTKDYLQIFDKVNDTWTPLARYCGRDLPKYVNSTDREMKVIFHTDGDGDGDGFTAAWSENCGGVFKVTGETQFITSPRYPDRYVKNLYCNYSLVAKNDEQISVKFLDFELEETARTCNFDNVTIYRRSIFSFMNAMEEVGTYCWKDSISSFRYPYRIDVVFRTDAWIERRGFKFEYSTDKCGGIITSPATISSISGNDDGYLDDAKCVWNITAPIDKKIVVRFEELDLEHNSECYLDYVDVYEGHATVESHRKARLCGNLTEHAPSISIQSNKALVSFSTDSSIHKKGFRALILFKKNCDERIELNASNPYVLLNKLTTQYEELLDCEYVVTVPKGNVIQLKFQQMHLAPCVTTDVLNSCTCDYLNIRDGAGPFADSFGSFCGHKNPADILTTKGSLYMRFITDNIEFSTGFSVELRMINSPCGPSIREIGKIDTQIEIEPPMDGNHYMPNVNCLWEIKTTEDDIIDIKFERFDLEEDPTNKCNNDYVEISDEESKPYVLEGLGDNSIFSGTSKTRNQYFFWGRQWPVAAHRYCGAGKPIDYWSLSKTVYVRFKSNEAIEKTGFKLVAKSMAECERNYTRTQGRLFAKTSSDCELYINVPENYTISLYFTTLEYHMKVECTDENAPVKIFNGKNNQLLGSYCGDVAPKPVFSDTNLLKFIFKKVELDYVATTGLYDITYVASDKGRGCGGELFNFGGMFTSPGYPNTDRNNSDCVWTVNVPKNLIVALQFQVFDMGSKATCELNFLEIIEFDEIIAPTRYCGTDNPASYKGRSNRLNVRFKSGMNFSGTGWIINFMAIHENSEITKY